MIARTEHRTKRTAARIAVAGAIVAAPLAALAIPAQADVVSAPAATDIAHPGHGHGPGDWDRRGDWDHRGDWDRHRRGNDCNPWDRHGNGWNGFRQVVPPGWFGSS
ncbi:hypothetical protein [Nocardia mikamii]|uniref:hypothetical protein n=1 Tax=Nocardia mikamii TaxID=508464 RepID=UPI000AEEF124|nr:hypothetical protein [Nocardia mikamii]